jgi:pyruvate kinase
MILWVVKKNIKKITLSTKGKKSIKFKIKKGYDYIEINGAKNNKWSINYSEYFPTITCM